MKRQIGLEEGQDEQIEKGIFGIMRELFNTIRIKMND